MAKSKFDRDPGWTENTSWKSLLAGTTGAVRSGNPSFLWGPILLIIGDVGEFFAEVVKARKDKDGYRVEKDDLDLEYEKKMKAYGMPGWFPRTKGYVTLVEEETVDDEDLVDEDTNDDNLYSRDD